MSILVTDGNQRATLAVVRALGRQGIRVTVGSDRPNSLAGSSRYCSNRICYPSPERDPASFQSYIAEEARHGHYRVLLPMADITMGLIADIRSEFAEPLRLPIPRQEQVNSVQNKGYVLELAEQLGICCPQTFIPDTHEKLRFVAQRICYPVVIKPRFSSRLVNGKWKTGRVQYAHGPEDLETKYSESHACIPNPLIQEKIEGQGVGVFLLLWNGDLKAAFCHQRLREKPPSGGVSVFRQSIPLDEQLLERSSALLKALRWQGPAMVEYKLDQRDGRPKLIEINGRFWGSLQLAIDAGLNFPQMFYRLACGEQVPAQFNYRHYVKSRWLLGDLDHLWIRLAHWSDPNLCSSNPPSRRRAFLDFLRFYEPDLHYEVFRLQDPVPGFYEWTSYIAEVLGQFRSKNGEEHAH
jgi:predicted ATP-grasp superfamily ATP-dependent carboligase